MSSQYIGIEAARKTLGDLVTAAQQGTDTILTRNGRPAARLTTYQPEASMSEYTITAAGNGRWRVLRDGNPMDGYQYDTDQLAQTIADRNTDRDHLNNLIEQAIGQTWHYGITVTSEPVPGRTPIWWITDPHRKLDNFAFAHYLPGPPPVSVYTRVQYEQACTAVGLTPAADTQLGTYADHYFQITTNEHPAPVVIEHELRGRRMAGLAREKAAEQTRREQQLTDAGLADGPYSREEYERACTIMGVPAITDTQASIVAGQMDLMAGTGIIAGFGVDPDQSEVAVSLVTRRGIALARDAAERGDRCDECGAVIIGPAMIASLGRACDVDCYDAMADRPGRYATSARKGA